MSSPPIVGRAPSSQRLQRAWPQLVPNSELPWHHVALQFAPVGGVTVATPLRADPLDGVRMAIYYLAISLLIAHELDAVTHSEWRLFFVLRDLHEATAVRSFALVHVPLVFATLWSSHHSNASVRDRTKLGVSIFLVVHAGLHFALSGTPQYDFDGLLSRGLILGSALFGALYVVLRFSRAFDQGARES